MKEVYFLSSKNFKLLKPNKRHFC